MFFETLITLPDGNTDSPISVKRFKTDVPNTSQYFADMAAKILFESIDVGGSNAPIEIEVCTTAFAVTMSNDTDTSPLCSLLMPSMETFTPPTDPSVAYLTQLVRWRSRPPILPSKWPLA